MPHCAKIRTLILIALFSLGVLARAAEIPIPEPLKVTVTAEELAPTPISELLYGNFVELGYGLQVEPMTAEMFFNRSFEPYTPYNGSNWYWFGVYKNLSDPGKGVEPDWRKMIWYHSGYEHNAWFAAPGSEGPFSITPESTFFIEKSPALNVELKLDQAKADVRHGRQAARLINREAQRWGALAQEGKWLRKGTSYDFSGLMKSIDTHQAEIRLYPRGSWDKPLTTIPLKGITPEYSRKSCRFKNSSFEGYATFSLWIPPQSSLTVDDFSLVAQPNDHGWRPDVIEASRRVAPKVMRFPGGCFASYYDWREGIGPRANRMPRTSYAWGGLNYNDVGTGEFAWFCKAIGAEMMFCVNLYHPAKQHYSQIRNEHGEPAKSPHGLNLTQFTNLEEGARSAADWVAYCNLPAGKHPMAALRAKNGSPKPFGVKFWECDNETFRWFTPEEYARAVVVYARAMQAVDPTIKVGLIAYGWDQPERAIPAMLAICGRDIDFLADRGDTEGELELKLKLMRAFNAANGTHIQYCNTEWFPYEGGEFNVYQGITDNSTWSRHCRWFHGLFVLKNFMAWQRQGGDVLFVNYNNFANTHGQNVIDTPKEGVFISADGKALELLSHSPAAWPLRLQGYEARVENDFQVQAAWDKARKRLVLYVLNRTDKPREAAFDLSALGRKFCIAQARTLRADEPMARNTLEHPDAIRLEQGAQANVASGKSCLVKARPWSFVEVILK